MFAAERGRKPSLSCLWRQFRQRTRQAPAEKSVVGFESIPPTPATINNAVLLRFGSGHEKKKAHVIDDAQL